MEKLVRITEEIPEIKLVGRKLGPFSEGEETYLRWWEASLLEDKELVEPVGDFSITGIRNRLIKEEKSSQLNALPSHFYLTVSRRIRRLKGKGELEEAEEMNEALDSLISLRVQKLARMAISSVVPDDVPPEEIFLVARLSRALRLWRPSLDISFEESDKEEVGTHREREWRSIQGTVRDATDI